MVSVEVKHHVYLLTLDGHLDFHAAPELWSRYSIGPSLCYTSPLVYQAITVPVSVYPYR